MDFLQKVFMFLKIMDGEKDMNTGGEVKMDDNAPVNTTGEGGSEQKEEKSFGPVVGIIIIVIILILGGFYFWGQKVSEDVSLDDGVADALEIQGESDEVLDIEADLSDTQLDNLIDDLDNIEDELGL